VDDAGWWSATLPDWIVAVFSIVIAVIAIFQWHATRQTNELTTAIERAFVSPGLVEIARMEDGKDIQVLVPLKNSGRATAHVSVMATSFHVLKPGETPPVITPDRLPREDTAVFIPSDQTHPFVVTWQSSAPTDENITSLRDSQKVAWIVGHMEFSDEIAPFASAIGYARKLTFENGKFQFVGTSDSRLNYLRRISKAERRKKRD
jgi:hypothetical protein